MYAIIAAGGKQYKVTEGEELFIEKLTAEEISTMFADMGEVEMARLWAEDVAAESPSDDAVADESLGSEDAEIPSEEPAMEDEPSEEPSTADLFNLDDMDMPATLP